jgi:hypothetical protein
MSVAVMARSVDLRDRNRAMTEPSAPPDSLDGTSDRLVPISVCTERLGTDAALEGIESALIEPVPPLTDNARSEGSRDDDASWIANDEELHQAQS